MLEALDELVGQIPPRILLGACLLILATPGLLDHARAGELSISMFSLIAVGIAAWYGGNLGFWMALVSALVSLVSDLRAGHADGNALTPFGNAALRFGFLMIFSYLLAFQRGRLRRETTNARIDPLTGVRSVTGFFSDTTILWGLATRQGHTTSLAYLDLDDFKQLNDTQGHAAGDAALRAVAATLSETVRSTDVVARLGGDEFAVFLPETASEGATLVLERVRDRILRLAQARGWPIAVSVGAVVIRPPYPSFEQAMRAADRLMYRAKQAGKSRVVIEPVDMSEAGAG
jgi:diguanylate cyclase (GGDEF)-like protein